MSEEREGISVGDLDVVAKLVLKLGGYAEGLFGSYDFGVDRATFQSHVTGVYDAIKQVQQTVSGAGVGLGHPYVPDAAVWDNPGQPWNYMQALRFSVGVSLSVQKYRKWMSPQTVERALTAKILHNCLMGMMDDLVDRGEYSYLEAKDVHHLVLSSMIDPEFDSNAYTRRLISILKSNQIPMFDLMNALTRKFNYLWNHSPHGPEYFYYMEMLDDRVALAQAITMFQKGPQFLPAKLQRIAASFQAPSDQVPWWARLAAHISASTRYNLIDMAFCDPIFDFGKLRNFMDGWYYLDSAITLLDHVTSIYKDLRGGIANLSLFAMREDDLMSRPNLQGYHPELSNDDYEGHLHDIAGLVRTGLRMVVRDFDEHDGYYPFLALMMPVVLMADWIGNRDEMIHAYIAEIAPTVRMVAGGPAFGEGAERIPTVVQDR